MLPPYIVLDKKLGQTPLEAIDAWRLAQPMHARISATYAGRLDPMATGRLLVLLGDECKKQTKYRALDKEYVVEVLLDLSTDTGDILGMPTRADAETYPDPRDIARAIREEVGTKEVPYPAFSSKTVHGKPLFLYALEGTLDTITVPSHQETIYRIVCERSETITARALRERIDNALSQAPRSLMPSKELGADFRREDIAHAWSMTLKDRSFAVLTLRVTCASGTYMRSLAGRIGEALGTRGMALSIDRTRIGTYKSAFGVGFWTREYR